MTENTEKAAKEAGEKPAPTKGKKAAKEER